MTSEEQPTNLPSTWIDVARTIAEGGVPQMIAGPAGKAISRLIAGAADIPAAWFEGKAQAIKDSTATRSKIMAAIASASADIAASDPLLLDRALERHISEIYRKQTNREDVARRTAEQLASDPPAHEQTEELREEWMDAFEKDVATANSDRLRDLYSRILAGEIRKPGAFSLSTLRAVTILDTTIANTFERVVPFIVSRDAIIKETVEKSVAFSDILELESAGLLLSAAGMMTMTVAPQDDGFLVVACGKETMLVRPETLGAVQIPVFVLTRAGRELATLSSVETNIQAVADYFWTRNAKEINIGPEITLPDGRTAVATMRAVPRSEPMRQNT